VTLLIQGANYPKISNDNAHDARAKLEALGIEAAWGEYEMGHELNQSALRDLVAWLETGPFAERDRSAAESAIE
jgi:predicted esterase